MKMQHYSGQRQRRSANSRLRRAAAESLEPRRLLSAYGLAPLYKFTAGSDGREPYSSLTAFNGLLYGTTYTGGADGAGNIFSVNPANNHVTPAIATFNNINGYAPANCALTVVGQNLYIASNGSITQPTKISVFNPASGSLSLFSSFPAPATNANPEIVETMLDVGGNLYGVASRYTGTENQTYIFECNVITRAITPLVSFSDGAGSTLVDYNDSLYGVGAKGIYQYNLTTKAFKVFPVVSEYAVNLYYNGLTNVGGMFYGADYYGGSSNDGSLFQFDPATGKLTTLASFTHADAGPVGDMTYANGNLYGTAVGNYSAAFEYNIAAKTLTTIAQIGSIGQGGANGGLVDVNGALYGTCPFGENSEGFGAVFALIPATPIQLSSTLHNITLRVDPSYPDDLEVLNGTTQYEEIYLPPASITVKGDSATSNSVTVDYKSGGFFDSAVNFLGVGANNSLSIVDGATPTLHNWNVDTDNMMATGTGLAANPTVDYNAVQHVSLTTRSTGNETITVRNAALNGQILPSSITLHITTNVAVDIKQTASPITIDGTGSASSTLEGVTIGSTAASLGGTLASILAPITVNNVSELIVDDSGDTANRTGKMSSNSITGFGLPGSNAINYTSVGTLIVHGGSGSNTDAITGTSAATTLYPGTSAACDVYVRAATAALTINGNDKVDYITIGSLAPTLGGTLTAIAGPITVTNTSAASTLDLDDSGDNTYRTGTLTPSKISGLGMGSKAVVNYTGKQLASLTIRGGKKGGTLTETGTSTTTNVIGMTVKT